MLEQGCLPATSNAAPLLDVTALGRRVRHLRKQSGLIPHDSGAAAGNCFSEEYCNGVPASNQLFCLRGKTKWQGVIQRRRDHTRGRIVR